LRGWDFRIHVVLVPTLPVEEVVVGEVEGKVVVVHDGVRGGGGVVVREAAGTTIGSGTCVFCHGSHASCLKGPGPGLGRLAFPRYNKNVCDGKASPHPRA